MEDIHATLVPAYADLVSRLSKLEFLESVTRIGAPVEDRPPEKVLDIDIVLVVSEPMTAGKHRAIEDIVTGVCRAYTTPATDVLYAIAEGPMKPLSFKPQEIFFHILLHTPVTYRANPLVLVKNSWQYQQPVKGKPLRDYHAIPGVTKEMLLDTTLGIRDLQQLVEREQSAYNGWAPAGEQMIWKKFPLTFAHPEEKAEIYIYAVLRCASNALRLVTGDNTIGIDEHMVRLFPIHFGHLTRAALPAKLLALKRLLRNKQPLSDVGEMKKQALAFLAELEEDISRR